MPRPKGTDGTAEALLHGMAFQLGKWIYIMDAFDDYERDRKRSACNLLDALNGGTAPEKADAFDMALTLHPQIKHKNGGLLRGGAGPLEDACIRNIATHGIDAVFYKIVRKRYREFAERVEQFGDFSVEQLAGKGP